MVLGCTMLHAKQTSGHPAKVFSPAAMRSMTDASSMMVYDSIVSYDMDGNYRTKSVYTYDANKNSIIGITSSWDGSTWINEMKEEEVFNAQDKLIEHGYYQWENDGWVCFDKTLSTYDANTTTNVYYAMRDGALVCLNKKVRTYVYPQLSEVYYNRVNDEWELWKKNEYLYDQYGHVCSSAEYLWQDDQWQGDWKQETCYNADGSKTGLANYYWKDGAWVGDFKKESILDADGNLSYMVSYIWEDGQWVESQKIRHERSYDANSNIILEMQSKLDSDSWIAFYKKEYTYDDKGNPVNWIEYNYSYSVWQAFAKGLYSYNEQGELRCISYQYDDIIQYWAVKTIETFDENGRKIREEGNNTRYEYEYDEESGQTIETCYIWDGNEWIGNYKTPIYIYDDYDNMILYISYDWEDGQWVESGYKYDSTYDENGDLLEDLYYEYIDNEWIPIERIVYYYTGRSTGMQTITSQKPTTRFDLQGRPLSTPTHRQMYIEGGDSPMRKIVIR